MTDIFVHLKQDDYYIMFPSALDAVPVLVDKRTYIDDWIFNLLYAGIQNVEQFIIDNPALLEV